MFMKNTIKGSIILLISCLMLAISSCKKDRPLSINAPTNSVVTVEEAKAWLKKNKPDLDLNNNWDSPIILTSENGNKVLKIRLNETLYEKKSWVIRDVIFQKDSVGKIQAFGYKVFVDNAYFSNKNGANEPLADKRSFINGADFTGKVVIYTLDNHAIKGWKYLNGKVETDLVVEIKRGSNQNPLAIKPKQKGNCPSNLRDSPSCADGGSEEQPIPFDGGENGHPLREVPITAPAPKPGWTPSNNPTGPIPIGNPNPGPRAGGGDDGEGNNSVRAFEIDGCPLTFDFDSDNSFAEGGDPPKKLAKINYKYTTPNGTLFTEWTDNTGRVHLHADMVSYYKGFAKDFWKQSITLANGLNNIFEMFKAEKLVAPVSWGSFYGAEAEYTFKEMGEYYKDKKERNKKAGGSDCKK